MQFMTDHLKFVNSLKFFGALAECRELLKAFSRSITVFTLSLSFVTLCRRFAPRFNSPSIRRQCELGIFRIAIKMCHRYLKKNSLLSFF